MKSPAGQPRTGASCQGYALHVHRKDGTGTNGPSLLPRHRVGQPCKVKEEEKEKETAEWRESLREHFREPMQCEVRERSLGARCGSI